MFVKWIIGVYTDVMSNTEVPDDIGDRRGRKMEVSEKAFQKSRWLHHTGEGGICQVRKRGEAIGMVVECISRRQERAYAKDGESLASLGNGKYFGRQNCKGPNRQIS